MVGNVSWGGDTLVEGVEHVEGSEELSSASRRPSVVTLYYKMYMRLVTP